MSNRAGKGSAFERQIAKQLSLWWTQDLPEPRDDIFWRTSNSGGRATTRGKRGRGTKGQHGDLCATDPLGEPFLRFVTVELKRGYNRDTLADLLDQPKHAKQPAYDRWIEKAERCREQAKARFWLLIVKRDRREPIVVFPREMSVQVRGGSFFNRSLRLQCKSCDVQAMLLEAFLGMVPPSLVKELVS